MNDVPKMFHPDYWLCKRCDTWQDKEDFFDSPRHTEKIKEYKICSKCRKSLKGPKPITKEEYERRKVERLRKAQA